MTRLVRIAPLVVLSAGIASAAEIARTPSAAEPVIAEVDGVKLTRADLERKNPARLFQARNAYYEAERKAIDEFIDEYLLERQAKKEGVSIAELLERHVNSKIAGDPSEDALRVYYEGVDTNESFEAVRPKIVEHLRGRRAARVKAAYMKSLRSEAAIALRVDAPRVQISLQDTPIRGSQSAPVTLVEYADYECPYCQQIAPVLARLSEEYADRLAFAYKDVPLPMHTNAQKASEAAHCAGNQGKYWQYHDLLFASKQLDAARLTEHAQTLRLDTEAFNKCLESGEKSALVKAQLAEAQTLGLSGTPSFFINGRFFSGMLPYEKLKEIVEEELVRAGQEQKRARR